MDSTLLSGIIGGVCTISAALLGKVGFFDNIFDKNPKSIAGEWISTWEDNKDTFIIKQSGRKISGSIMDSNNNRFDIEGKYDNRFLYLFYSPSKTDTNPSMEHGCYFFKYIGNNEFRGGIVGIENNDKISTVSTILKKR